MYKPHATCTPLTNKTAPRKSKRACTARFARSWSLVRSRSSLQDTRAGFARSATTSPQPAQAVRPKLGADEMLHRVGRTAPPLRYVSWVRSLRSLPNPCAPLPAPFAGAVCRFAPAPALGSAPAPAGFALGLRASRLGGRASGVASHLLERARTFSASAPLAPLRPIARQFGRAVAQTRGFAPQTVRSTRPPFWLAGAKRRIVARFAPVRYHFAATSEITKPLTAQKKGRIVWTHSQRFKCEKPRRLQSTGLF